MAFVKKKKVSFVKKTIVKEPVRVRFVNKHGGLVSFKATKKVAVPKRVIFYAKDQPKIKKKKKW